MQFNFDYRVTFLFILWALGWSMIVLSGLVYLPSPWVTAIGVLMISTHNLFDSVRSSSPIWSILHSPGIVYSNSGHIVFVAYPLIPWIGVTAAGFGLGRIYIWTAERRKAILLRLGLGLTLAFTFLSFLNTNKYPPSLLFLLMTLGPAMLFLWAFDGRPPRFLRPALIFGKVPMFYYLLHISLIHLLAVLVCFARYRAVYWMLSHRT